MRAAPRPHLRHNPDSPSARAIEIEPGRRVPNTWDDAGPHLFERWADRKARLAADRAEAAALLLERLQSVARREAFTAETRSGFGGRA